MTSDNKTFMLILNILFMAPRMVLLISEDERKENSSESDSGDSYLALSRLGEWDQWACWCTNVFGVYVYIIMFPV